MKPTEFIVETSQIAQEADDMHSDHEVQMARSDCYSAAKYAIELHRMLKEVSEQQGLDGWVSEKITLANDYLRTVHEYLSHEMAHDQEQVMMSFTAEAAEYAFDQLLVEDDYDDAVADFLSKNKPTVGKTHKPRQSERLGGSRHIGGGGDKMKASRTGISSKPTGKAVAGQASLGEDGQKGMSRAAKGHEKYGKEGMAEGRVDQMAPGGADYSKHSTDELKAMLRPGVMGRNELKFKTLIRRELKKREQQGVAEAGPAQGEYSRVLTALRLYYPRFEIEELNTPDWHRVIANKANVTPEYAGQVIDDFVKASQPDEEENLDWMDDTNDVREGVAALAKAGREGKDLDKIRDKYNKYDESRQVSEMATGGGSSAGGIATSMGGPGHKPTSGVPKKLGNAAKMKKVAVGKGVY
jgi:hypothetical protein